MIGARAARVNPRLQSQQLQQLLPHCRMCLALAYLRDLQEIEDKLEKQRLALHPHSPSVPRAENMCEVRVRAGACICGSELVQPPESRHKETEQTDGQRSKQKSHQRHRSHSRESKVRRTTATDTVRGTLASEIPSFSLQDKEVKKDRRLSAPPKHALAPSDKKPDAAQEEKTPVRTLAYSYVLWCLWLSAFLNVRVCASVCYI